MDGRHSRLLTEREVWPLTPRRRSTEADGAPSKEDSQTLQGKGRWRKECSRLLFPENREDKENSEQVWTCLFSLGVLCLAASHVLLCVSPWTAARQAPLSVGFSRQEYWSRLPRPPPGELLNPGIEPRSPALQADSLQAELSGKPCFFNCL